MSVSDSPPQVENASSTKGKQGSNFSVKEDQLLVCWGTINEKTNKFCGCMVKITIAKALYKKTFKKPFLLEHCWLVLKDQPKWADPNGRSRAPVPPTLEATSISEGDCGSELGDTSNFERPIGRKVEKANRKNKATGKDKKMFIEREKLRIEKERGEEKLKIDKERGMIERKKFEMQYMLEEERIMIKDTSVLTGAQKTFYEQLQEKIMASLSSRN
ncbi:hypothetical protein ACB092_09G045900 [Castanea dentata]